MTNETTPQKSGKIVKLLAGLVIFAVGAYGVYSIFGGKSNEQTSKKPIGEIMAFEGGFTKAVAKGDMTAFLVHAKRKPVPELAFKNGKGEPLSLKDWKGKVVLINLWATWCGPCRKEMPDLAKLQKQLGGDDFEVVAISVDRKGVKASGRFLAEAKATDLNLYVDQTTKVMKTLRAIGLPITVLVDRNGNEVGRLIGPALWDGADAIRLIKTAIAEK